MPKEVIQYGDPYVRIYYEESDTVSYSDVSVSRDVPEDDPSPMSLVEHHAPGMPKGDSYALTRKPNLEVYWSRSSEFSELRRFDEDEEGNVQIMLDLDKTEVLDLAARFETDPDMVATAAITGKLSRYQINKLIKTLRRARDAAFGTDE
jgi:hypothetical protein